MELTLNNNDYLADGVKKEYDYEIETPSHLIAQMGVSGVFVIVSFIGVCSPKDDEDFWEAMCGVWNAGFSSQEHTQNHIFWFYDFCNSNWDKNEELFKNDDEIQKRFKAFLPIWWKIVCEVFHRKFANKTFADWIAKKREAVGTFLEKKVENGEICEQAYIASYNSYKCAYDFCSKMLEDYTMTRMYVAKTIADNYILEFKDIKRWNVVSKSTIIYDRDNNFHFIVRTKMSVIKEQSILDLAKVSF